MALKINSVVVDLVHTFSFRGYHSGRRAGHLRTDDLCPGDLRLDDLYPNHLCIATDCTGEQIFDAKLSRRHISVVVSVCIECHVPLLLAHF